MILLWYHSRPNVVFATLSLGVIPFLFRRFLFNLCFPFPELGKDGRTIRFLLQIPGNLVYVFPRYDIGRILLKLNKQRANFLFAARRQNP